jgi:hypothetical protein
MSLPCLGQMTDYMFIVNCFKFWSISFTVIYFIFLVYIIMKCVLLSFSNLFICYMAYYNIFVIFTIYFLVIKDADIFIVKYLAYILL